MSKNIVQITNYDINNSLLLQQFKEREKFIQLIQTISNRSNDLEDAIFEVRDLYWIDTAEGEQLNVLGEIHGIARNGRTDSDYRDVIKVKIIVNNGSGEPEIIITALTGIYGATKAQLTNIGGGNLQIWVDISLSVSDYTEILEMIGAGIGLIFVAGSGVPFVHFGDPDGLGYGYLIPPTVPLEVDFGAGVVDLEVDFSGASLINADEGGEYQSLLGQT